MYAMICAICSLNNWPIRIYSLNGCLTRCELCGSFGWFGVLVYLVSVIKLVLKWVGKYTWVGYQQVEGSQLYVIVNISFHEYDIYIYAM